MSRIVIIDNINLYKENDVKIFNQWNSEVYAQKGYTNNWDGDGLPDGTYYYIIKIRYNGEIVNFDGPLTVIR